VLGLDDLRVLAPRFDLGVRALVPEWRALVRRAGAGEDALDGLLIASTMLPLSLWVAAVSGAPPETGIVSAAISTLLCVLFGGTHLAMSGPGITTALLVASIASDHGMGGVGAVVVLAGAFQLAVGALGLGRFARLVPLSVVRGSVIGVGAFMLLLHLPATVGLPLDDAPILARLDDLGAHLPQANLTALAIAAVSAVIAIGAAAASKKLPGAFAGALVTSLVVAVAGLEMPALETGDRPAIAWPVMPTQGLVELLFTALALWLTSVIGTLTSSMALEGTAHRETDPDQELIAQGLSGIAAGLAGCLPPGQDIARSAYAHRAGARSRRAALIHAVVVLAAGAAIWPVVEHVPVAALTGAVFATAVPLLDPRPLRAILRITRFELAIGIVTAVGVALFGIAQGIESGLALAVIAATFRLARTRALLHHSEDPATSPHQVSFSGPITFLATLELRRLRRELERADASAGLVVDLRNVVAIDATGAFELVTLVRACKARELRVALLGASSAVKHKLCAAAGELELEPLFATSARNVEPILEKSADLLGRRHLLAGVERFREEMRDHYDSLFDQLADGQHPHTMFITCADSRINPGLLLGAHPGDLFIVRCIGAGVPGPDHEHMTQEGAALEYGVGVLGVRHVIVCGHSQCGAIKALKSGSVPKELATLGRWSEHASGVAGELGSFEEVNAAVRAVTLRQLDHLKSYPLVRERLESGALHVHAWFYDLEAVELFEYDEGAEEFKVLGGGAKSDA
jgi:carbonic anhydrase